MRNAFLCTQIGSLTVVMILCLYREYKSRSGESSSPTRQSRRVELWLQIHPCIAIAFFVAFIASAGIAYCVGCEATARHMNIIAATGETDPMMLFMDRIALKQLIEAGIMWSLALFFYSRTHYLVANGGRWLVFVVVGLWLMLIIAIVAL